MAEKPQNLFEQLLVKHSFLLNYQNILESFLTHPEESECHTVILAIVDENETRHYLFRGTPLDFSDEPLRQKVMGFYRYINDLVEEEESRRRAADLAYATEFDKDPEAAMCRGLRLLLLAHVDLSFSAFENASDKALRDRKYHEYRKIAELVPALALIIDRVSSPMVPGISVWVYDTVNEGLICLGSSLHRDSVPPNILGDFLNKKKPPDQPPQAPKEN